MVTIFKVESYCKSKVQITHAHMCMCARSHAHTPQMYAQVKKQHFATHLLSSFHKHHSHHTPFSFCISFYNNDCLYNNVFFMVLSPKCVSLDTIV